MTKGFGVAAVVALFLLLTLGCGGSGGGSATPNTTVYSTAKLTSLATGNSFTLNLTGSDTLGGTYTGSFQSVVTGPTVVNGVNVIEKQAIINITRTGSGTSSLIADYYYNSDGSTYGYVTNTGESCVSTSSVVMPSTVTVGYFGAGPSMSCNNGTVFTSTWQVQDGGNGNANVIVTLNFNSATSETATYVLSPSGDIVGVTMMLYNDPSGANTTLTGS
jgi:hypothetical protein